METALIVGFVIVIAALYGLHKELRRVEARLIGQDDHAPDTKIDDDVKKECEAFEAHKDKLHEEKKALPGISLWGIARSPGDWEAQLMAKADELRNLIVYATADIPDAFHIEQHAREMPMTFKFAHALAELADLRNDISVARADWSIWRIKLLGLMRKRTTKLGEIVYAERKLREIEEKLKALEVQWERRRSEVCDAVFEDMRKEQARTT